MKKKIAIGNFIVLALIIVLCFVFSFVSFKIPGTTLNFKGFLGALPKSLEYTSGITATYEVEIADYYNGSEEEAVDIAINRVHKLLKNDYSESIVEKIGENKIKITVPGNYFNTNNIVGLVEISTSQPSELSALSEEELAEKIDITCEHIKNIEYKAYNGVPGIYIEFTDEGNNELSKIATSEVNIYIYTDKNYDSYFSAVTIDSQVAENGFMFLSGGNIKTKSIAVENSEKLATGLLGVNMSIVGDYSYIENAFATQCVSNQSLFLTIFLSISVVAIIALTFAFLYRKYKELGLVSMLSLASFLALNIIVFSIIENLVLSVGIVFAFIVSYALAFIAHFILLEKISKEYSNGTKFIASFKNGYKKSIASILDIFAPIWFGVLITYFVSYDLLYSISYFMIISILIALFTSLLTFRWFISIYLKINNSKSKKVNFKREVAKNEEIE